MDTAQTILDQMGGTGRLVAMIGARCFVGDTDSVQFSFSGNRKVNKCHVILEANDTYTFQLWKYVKKTGDCNLVYEVGMVYADNLREIFKSQTGLALSI